MCARCEKIADKRATRRGREDEVIDADAPLSVATENWFAIGDNFFDGEKKKKTDEKVEAKRIQLVEKTWKERQKRREINGREKVERKKWRKKKGRARYGDRIASH